MSGLGIVAAFRRYGAVQANPQWAVTAVAGDGSLVVSCWRHLFSRPSKEVMRYEDRLSRWGHNTRGTNLARRHFEQALEEGLRVRLVIGTSSDQKAIDEGGSGSESSKTYHVREDLVGRVVEFDGDRFAIDFRRAGS